MPKRDNLLNTPYRMKDERAYKRAIEDVRDAIEDRDIGGLAWGVLNVLIARNAPACVNCRVRPAKRRGLCAECHKIPRLRNARR